MIPRRATPIPQVRAFSADACSGYLLCRRGRAQPRCGGHPVAADRWPKGVVNASSPSSRHDRGFRGHRSGAVSHSGGAHGQARRPLRRRADGGDRRQGRPARSGLRALTVGLGDHGRHLPNSRRPRSRRASRPASDLHGRRAVGASPARRLRGELRPAQPRPEQGLVGQEPGLLRHLLVVRHVWLCGVVPAPRRGRGLRGRPHGADQRVRQGQHADAEVQRRRPDLDVDRLSRALGRSRLGGRRRVRRWRHAGRSHRAQARAGRQLVRAARLGERQRPHQVRGQHLRRRLHLHVVAGRHERIQLVLQRDDPLLLLQRHRQHEPRRAGRRLGRRLRGRQLRHDPRR